MLTYIWLVWSCLCCYLFHLAWWGTEKARRAEREIKGQWPFFEHPNLLKWNYWTMLLQSVTIAPFRIALFVAAFVVCLIAQLCLGTVNEENWIKRRLSSLSIFVCILAIFLATGFKIEINQINFDYSKWLGPKWQEEAQEFHKTKTVPTVIANHTSGLFDVFTLLYLRTGHLGMVAASFIRGVPVISHCLNAGDAIYVNREGSHTERDKLVDTIAERQNGIMNRKSPRKPLGIFPEGFSTIGGISKFKRGAFNSLNPVTPVCLKQLPATVYIGCYSSADHCPMIARMCTLGINRMQVDVMPSFIPNEFLFAQRPDTPKWEVFADAVREAMLEHSQLKPSDMSYTKSREYMAYFQKHDKFAWSKSFDKDKKQ